MVIDVTKSAGYGLKLRKKSRSGSKSPKTSKDRSSSKDKSPTANNSEENTKISAAVDISRAGAAVKNDSSIKDPRFEVPLGDGTPLQEERIGGGADV